MIVETIEQVQKRLTDLLQSNPNLYDPSNPDPTKRGLTSISQTAAWINFLNIIATEIVVLQNLMSIYETEIEGIVNDAAPETLPWVKDRVLKFQYDASDPQVVQVNSDLSVGYPVENEDLRVVDQCAVVPNSFGGLLIKVASGSPLAPISSPELAALDSYLSTILGGDITYQLINAVADILKLVGTVYYNGQYNSVIVTNVVNALNTYLSTLGFNGIVKISDIVTVIKSVKGVTDVVLTDAVATSLMGAGTVVNLIESSTEYLREYQSYSGYVVNDPANLFSDTLSFVIDNQ